MKEGAGVNTYKDTGRRRLVQIPLPKQKLLKLLTQAQADFRLRILTMRQRIWRKAIRKVIILNGNCACKSCISDDNHELDFSHSSNKKFVEDKFPLLPVGRIVTKNPINYFASGAGRVWYRCIS